MHQILDSRQEERIIALFRLGFRPFFLFGALFATLTMLGWLAVLNGHWQLPAISNPIWWHSHEMLFGFGSAMVAGFLLTAVQNWTAHPGVRSWPLALLVGLWALPRIMLPWLGEANWLLMAADLLWLPLCAGLLARPIILTRQWRNLFFVPLLLLLTLLNGISWGWHDDWIITEHWLISTVLLFTVLIAVMGGRVIPFFTARATGVEKVAALIWLERLALGSLWLLLGCWLVLPTSQVTSPLMAPFYLMAAALHLWRPLRWRPFTTLRHPLLWSLHLAYLFIPAGMAAFAAHAAGWPISLSLASHLLSAGAMGTMILAMIARVSLGHSGRALQVGRRITLAFALVIAAALLRVLLPLCWPTLTLTGWNLSGLAWSLAYGLFVWVYAPILCRPRADGRPG